MSSLFMPIEYSGLEDNRIEYDGGARPWRDMLPILDANGISAEYSDPSFKIIGKIETFLEQMEERLVPDEPVMALSDLFGMCTVGTLPEGALRGFTEIETSDLDGSKRDQAVVSIEVSGAHQTMLVEGFGRVEIPSYTTKENSNLLLISYLFSPVSYMRDTPELLAVGEESIRNLFDNPPEQKSGFGKIMTDRRRFASAIALKAAGIDLGVTLSDEIQDAALNDLAIQIAQTASSRHLVGTELLDVDSLVASSRVLDVDPSALRTASLAALVPYTRFGSLVDYVPGTLAFSTTNAGVDFIIEQIAAAKSAA